MTKQERKERKDKLKEEIDLLTGRVKQLKKRLRYLNYEDQDKGSLSFAVWYLREKKGVDVDSNLVNVWSSPSHGLKIKPEYSENGKWRIFTRKCLDDAFENGFKRVDSQRNVKTFRKIGEKEG